MWRDGEGKPERRDNLFSAAYGAFSDEMETGPRQENAPNQESRESEVPDFDSIENGVLVFVIEARARIGARAGTDPAAGFYRSRLMDQDRRTIEVRSIGGQDRGR